MRHCSLEMRKTLTKLIGGPLIPYFDNLFVSISWETQSKALLRLHRFKSNEKRPKKNQIQTSLKF